MKGFITLLLVVFQLAAVGQTVYQTHEVEKVAEPNNGVAYLNQFIAANLQIPFRSAVRGINGRVYIKGIVEPDGSMTNIEVIKGLDTLSSLEAKRVIGLFASWKPALLKSEKVRQYVSYPIVFKAAPKGNFDSTRSAFVDYFDETYVPTQDPKKFEYRLVLPVDKRGFLRDNVLYEQNKGGRWKEVGSAVFEKKDVWYKFDFQDMAGDSAMAYQIAARDKNMASHSSESIFQPDGKLLAHTEYGLLNKIAMHKSYDLNGMLRVLRIYSDSLMTELTWHANGQIRNASETTIPKAPAVEQKIYVNAWNADGVQTVKDGDGYWRSVERAYNGKWLTEEGRVISGVKNGKWIGKWTDSTLDYEENYELGVLDKGFSYRDNGKVEYTEAKVNPQFKGGINEFYKFLGTNIRYPDEASRRGVSGKVKLSFIVCEDGTLCDYKIENRLGFGLEEEAMRVVRKMDGMWEPGVLRGKAVRVKYYLPVNFEIH
jgi:TonB family protein